MYAETEREKWASLRLLSRESEKFASRYSDRFSSSPDSMPTGVSTVTRSGCISSAWKQAEDDAVFHTPPEHHLDDLYSDAGFPFGRSKKARIFEAGLDDESSMVLLNFILQLPHFGRNCRKPICFDSERTRFPGEEFGARKNLIGDEAEVIALDSVGSGEEMNALQKNIEMSKGGVPEASGINGNPRSGKECKSTEDACVSKRRRPKKDSCLFKSRKLTIKLKCNGVTRTIHDSSSFGGSEKVLEEENKRFEKIDEFRYVGGAGSRRRWKDKTGGAGEDSQLTLEGKGDNARGNNEVELKSGLLDSLGVLKLLVGEMDGGCDDVDFLGTAKRRGLMFPRPRWWSAQGE